MDLFSKVQTIYKDLINGLTWDEIEKTNYSEIENKRKQNASIMEFAKLVFKIRINDKLLYISQNIKEIDSHKSLIRGYDFYSKPDPNRHARASTTVLQLVKNESIIIVPFLKNNIIKYIPRQGEARFMDA